MGIDRFLERVIRILGIGGGVLLLALSLLWFWVAREYRRDPMPLLDQPTTPLVIRTLQESTLLTATGEPRHLLEYELDGAPEGPIRVALSLPMGPERPLPVVVILGGLDVGRESLRYVETHGPNALVAFAYPRPTQDLYDGKPLFKLPRIRRAALAVPSQVCALLAWIRVQAWADPQRVSLLGYSFGTMFVPAAARVAQVRGIPFRTLVMAYGGADLPGLLAANSDLRPRVGEVAGGTRGGIGDPPPGTGPPSAPPQGGNAFSHGVEGRTGAPAFRPPHAGLETRSQDDPGSE